MKSFIIKTIGCKVNTYESNKIRDELIDLGFEYFDDEEKCYDSVDYFIINTCSVTNIADRKSRQMIHKAKKLNPNIKVIATGCYVNASLLEFDKNTINTKNDSLTSDNNVKNKNIVINECNDLYGIDVLVPNNEKQNIPRILMELENKKKTQFSLKDECHKKVEENILKNRIDEESIVKKDIKEKNIAINKNVRAFIKIQDGCNQYCSYCIIPFLRGNITSLSDDEVIDIIKNKLSDGVKEIVLTGIHLSSYGIDRANMSYESVGAIDNARKNLMELIKKICSLDKLERLRLGSLEPRIINDEFLSALNEENIKNKFCPNFCLSLQSGSDKILKNMNRHYTTVEYNAVCDLIRKKLPYATITTDVIVGFPGETNDDFIDSLNFVKQMRFYNPNIFPYSRREGTVADKLPNQIENSEKHRRAKVMISECEKITEELRNDYIKKYNNNESEILKNILVEEKIIEDNVKYAVGYTKEYMKFKIRIE